MAELEIAELEDLVESYRRADADLGRFALQEQVAKTEAEIFEARESLRAAERLCICRSAVLSHYVLRHWEELRARLTKGLVGNG